MGAQSCQLQDAADRHDLKDFYRSLKVVYGPCDSRSAPVLSQDGSRLLTEHTDIFKHCAEHFNTALNQQSNFDSTVLIEIPQRPTAICCYLVPRS